MSPTWAKHLKMKKTHRFWDILSTDCKIDFDETSNSQTKDSFKEPGKIAFDCGSRAPDLHLSFSPGLDLRYCPMSG